ncbi:MAG: primosomal protein N' [Candidatus Omnitrophica bacterium]|nr:primosomal protein N' [Candidatus Omnitrophota bacterium]
MKLVEVVFDIPLDKAFDYLPGQWEGKLQPGCRVKVPLGRQRAIGWVTGEKEVEKASYSYKSILKVYDKESLFPEEIMALCRYLSSRYCASLGQALATITGGMTFLSKTEEKTVGECSEKSDGRKTEGPVTSFSQPAGIFHYGRHKERDEYLLSLLSGITGSVLFLFPETEAADAFYQILNQLYPNQAILFHGELSGSTRLKLWRRMMKEKRLLVAATRLGVFVPLRDLSLLVMDSHWHLGYQEERQPRYQTGEVIRWRADKYQIPLIFTEASLSVSQYFEIVNNQARLVSKKTPERPTVRLLSLHRTARSEQLPFLTREAVSFLEEAILRGQKVVLLHHRKGTYHLLLCQECEYRFPCPDCSLPLTPAEKPRTLFCRFCTKEYPLPNRCPVCRSHKIVLRAVGLRTIEQNLKAAYPGVEIAIVTAERSVMVLPSARIILGTVSMEKFLEDISPAIFFVPAADAFLNLPDFRSEERFFCLVNRCRQKIPSDSLVLLQTYNPHLTVFQSLVENNDSLFYEKELQIRQELRYPPFTTLVKIEIEVRPEKKLEATRRLVESFLSRYEMAPAYNGPAYPPILRKKYRWKYLVKLSSQANLEKFRELNTWPEISLYFNPLEI